MLRLEIADRGLRPCFDISLARPQVAGAGLVLGAVAVAVSEESVAPGTASDVLAAVG